MRLGPLIRRLLGPYERPVTELYRRTFIDLDEFARIIAAWVPDPRRILEIGCGEGAVAEDKKELREWNDTFAGAKSDEDVQQASKGARRKARMDFGLHSSTY